MINSLIISDLENTSLKTDAPLHRAYCRNYITRWATIWHWTEEWSQREIHRNGVCIGITLGSQTHDPQCRLFFPSHIKFPTVFILFLFLFLSVCLSSGKHTICVQQFPFGRYIRRKSDVRLWVVPVLQGGRFRNLSRPPRRGRRNSSNIALFPLLINSLDWPYYRCLHERLACQRCSDH